MDYNIKRIYEQYQQTGHDSATRQGWSSAATQQANFKAMLDALQTLQLPLAGLSVHDVGCGFGDFYGVLQAAGGVQSYLGTDIDPHAIAAALLQHPKGDFRTKDVRTPWPADMGDMRRDVVLAMGALAFYRPRVVEETLHRLWADTKVALGFMTWWNLDKTYVYAEHAQALQKVIRRFLREVKPSQVFERIGDFAEKTDALFVVLK